MSSKFTVSLRTGSHFYKFLFLLITQYIISFSSFAQSWNVLGDPGFSLGMTNFNSMAIDVNNTPYVVYEDFANAYKATVMKYNGTTWVPVGISGFSASQAEWTSIAINGLGTPYVAYSDASNGWKPTVMKFDGTSWSIVGSPGFAGGEVYYNSLAFAPSGTPYIAYEDGYDGPITVKKFNGTDWVAVGDTGFSPGEAGYTYIAIDGAGTPYVVFMNNYPGPVTVMKFNGTSWVNVGSPEFSAGQAYFTSIAIDGSGTPYVSYSDYAYGQKATVMKFDGSRWVNLGSPGFSTGPITYTSLAIDNCGTPYLTFEDGNYTGPASVMKFNGTIWESAGSPDFSAGEANYTSMAIDGYGNPYVVYEDFANGEKATVMKLSLPSIGVGSGTLCVGDTVTLSDTMSGGAWSSSNTGIATIGSGGLATAMSAGTDTVMFTMGCQSATLSLTVNPLPSAGEISGAGDLCAGSASAYTDTAAGGVWSTGTASIAGIGSTGVMNGLAAGAAVLTYTVNNGICSAMVYDTVTVDPLPNAGVITGVDTICPGDTMRLADAVTGGAWSIANTSIASISGAGTVRGFAEGRDTAIYVVTNSCGSDTGVFSFFVRSPSACPNSVNTLISVAASMVVYPNPGAGLFTLRLNAEMNTPAQITVTNMLGEIVKSMTLPTNQNNDLRLSVPPGVYFISAAMGSEWVNGKVVVE